MLEVANLALTSRLRLPRKPTIHKVVDDVCIDITVTHEQTNDALSMTTRMQRLV